MKDLLILVKVRTGLKEVSSLRKVKRGHSQIRVNGGVRDERGGLNKAQVSGRSRQSDHEKSQQMDGNTMFRKSRSGSVQVCIFIIM